MISNETWSDIARAVKDGDLDKVQEIYRTMNLEYTDGDSGDVDKVTLLHLAAGEGQLGIVQFCLEQTELSVDITDRWGYTALIRAADQGHLSTVQYLVKEGSNVNFSENRTRGYTALMRTAIRGHKPVVEYLVEQGADVEMRDRGGYTALMYATQKGKINVVFCLLGVSEDMFSQEFSEWKFKNKANSMDLAVKYLVEEGLKNDFRWGYMNKVLVRCASWGNIDVVKYLISRGADVNHRNEYGLTALGVAMKNRKANVAVFISSLSDRTVKVGNFDINSRYTDGQTVLMWALGTGEVDNDIVKYLECEGVKAISNQDVFLAVEKNNNGVVKHAVKSKFDLNICDERGLTVLGAALAGKNIEIASYLCSLSDRTVKVGNFDLNSRYEDGHTVLIWAASTGEVDIVQYVAQHVVVQSFEEFEELYVKITFDFRKVIERSLNKILARLIKTSPHIASDSKTNNVFYRGTLIESLVNLYLVLEEQDIDIEPSIILRTCYVAFQAKVECRESKKHRLAKVLNGELFRNFKQKIELVRLREDDYGDHYLIATKIYAVFLRKDASCFKRNRSICAAKTKSCLNNCRKKLKTCHRKCDKTPLQTEEVDEVDEKKGCDCKLPRLSHDCKEKGTFALISCTLAVVFYLMDLITDITVGYEDYNGFSKRLGIFEIFLVVFTLMHENIRSSVSLYSTEKELLTIKLGKHDCDIEVSDWKESDLNKCESRVEQLIYTVFWPFSVLRKTCFLERLKCIIYNLLTVIQLRPVVDRLRVLLHSPTNLRVIYRRRTEQNSLKQFYLITEQLPELLIQFYTLQMVFNIGGSQFGQEGIFSTCTSGRNFSYDKFIDSLNNPEERNWFCGMFPITSARSQLTCEIFFRIFSALIPFFMIPSGIVSLEIGFRLLDPVTPNMTKTARYVLQAAYTLMIPGRLLMFAALMHSVHKKQFLFGYMVLRATLELVVNLLDLKVLENFFTKNVTFTKEDDETDIDKESVAVKSTTKNSKKHFLRRWYEKTTRLFLELKTLSDYLGAIWRISMFSLRDVFAVSLRKPCAYMTRPSNVTHDSIRDWESITKRFYVFLLEGIVGAWAIEEFYPCGRYSNIFRHVGWMCLSSLLLSVTLMTLISDLLHLPSFRRDKNFFSTCLRTARLGLVFGLIPSLIFSSTKQRTPAEKSNIIVIMLAYLTISAFAMLLIKAFAFPSSASSSKDDDRASNIDKNVSASCWCYPSQSNDYHYNRV